MDFAAAIEDGHSPARPVSPYREMGAYEALWTEGAASFRRLAEKFKVRPGALPSDFVPPVVADQHAQRACGLLSNAGVSRFGVIVYGTAEYPTALRVADHPVELLYFQGWWDLMYSPSVAVVGTRQPTTDGRNRARRVARELVGDGFTVVSGLASGIDTVAHEAAIEAGGRTIAVLGTPLNLRYPRENAALQDYLGREQLLLSQVPVLRYQQVGNPTANRFFFAERNITMAALTAGTVIVEAGETSGTLVQARHALKQGKKLFILENNFRNPLLTWPTKLEKRGAIRVRDYGDIRKYLDPTPLRDR